MLFLYYPIHADCIRIESNRIGAIQNDFARLTMEAYLAGCDDAWTRAVCGVTRRTMIEVWKRYGKLESPLNHP